ncbi:MAG: FMN-binding protein, partial [Bacteroidales bacterium]|nr:FMN-binding protein [Bacteroidales bacterium]
PDLTIYNTVVIQQKETPGLGTKMKDPVWKNQFNGKNPDVYNLKVKKDGGDVDAITAATISSRAFSGAISRAYEALKKQEGEPQP